VDSLRKAPATNSLTDIYGIDVLAALWLKVAQTIVVMADGGDPNVVTSVKALTDRCGSIYKILDWLTSQFTGAFFERDSRFEPQRLWDFVEQVDQWRRQDRTTARVLRISASFNIARTELNRLLQRETADHEAGHASRTGQPNPNTFEFGRLTISKPTRTVALGQKSAVIDDPVAFQVFLFIASARGALVTSKNIREQVPGCRKGRLDQILARHLPDWVRALIPGKKGQNGGYSLVLPEFVRNSAHSIHNQT
jgi:hypothetical protein